VRPISARALLPRHLLALAMVGLLAAGIGYSVKHTPPTYQESATLILTPPPSSASKYGDSLVTTGWILVHWASGPQGQQKLSQAGAGNGFSVGLVNLYNQEYPNYAYPFVTLSAAAADPATAHRLFVTGSQVFESQLLAQQAALGVLPRNRISGNVVGDTGPVESQGSRIRAYAGILVLTIVAAFFVSAFLDRHPIGSRLLRRLRRRGAGDLVAPGPAGHMGTPRRRLSG
jgi:hypothetical protein